MILKIKNGSFPFFLGILSFVGIFLNETVIPYILLILSITMFLEKNKGLNYNSNKSILTPFAIIIGVFLIYTLLSPDIVLALKVLERQISLLLIPFLMVFIKWNRKRVNIFFKAFIISTLFIGTVSILKFIWFIFYNSDWIAYMSAEKGSKLLYLQYKFPHVIGAHPTYWSYLIISAIVILWSNNNLQVFKSKSFIISLLVFFNINLLILASRTPLLINLLVHLFFLARFLNHKNITLFKKVSIAVFSIVLFFGGLQLPLLSNKLNIVKNDERLYYWPTAYKTIRQNYFILGEGLGQSNEVIKNEVILNGEQRVRYLGYDLHNQYLRVYVDMGVLGVVSLLALLFFPLFIKKKESLYGKSIYIPFLVLFSLGFMTESYLYRLKGIVFFAIFSSLLCICAKGVGDLKSSEKTIT